MSEDEALEEGEPKKKSKLPMVIGLVLALVGAGGGFFATYSGMLLGGGDPAAAADGHGGGQTKDQKAAAEADAAELASIAFVPVDALVISLGPASRSTHLRFSSQLEVESGHQEAVAKLMPRILDVLNGYLRAIEVHEIEDPAALVRLRAQMLRRIQIVTGEGRVRDLLVTEFVLN